MFPEYAGEMDHLVYSLFSVPGLSDDTVAGMAKAINEGRYFTSKPERYINAIEWALAQSDSITESLNPPYSEAAVREFLGNVHKELQRTEQRP